MDFCSGGLQLKQAVLSPHALEYHNMTSQTRHAHQQLVPQVHCNCPLVSSNDGRLTLQHRTTRLSPSLPFENRFKCSNNLLLSLQSVSSKVYQLYCYIVIILISLIRHPVISFHFYKPSMLTWTSSLTCTICTFLCFSKAEGHFVQMITAVWATVQQSNLQTASTKTSLNQKATASGKQ